MSETLSVDGGDILLIKLKELCTAQVDHLVCVCVWIGCWGCVTRGVGSHGKVIGQTSLNYGRG